MGRHIEVEQLALGTIIEKPVYRENGVLLVASETTVTFRIKKLLQEYSIDFVEIKDQPAHLIETSVEDIKQTKAFETFNKGLVETTKNFKAILAQVVNTEKPLDVETLVTEVNQLFQAATNNIQLLDMMYCMRDYDDLTYTHCVNVALMCHVMGKWLDLSPEDTQVLCLCGLLHDVGKTQIPQEIITKSQRLTEEEFALMKSHPVKSYDILKNQDIDERIKAVAYMHHEKCDGTGYPKGLRSNQIHDFAKIVTIIDIYDAMTADRVYRKGMCPFKVVEILINEGFEKYDPKYLLLFLERITETYINKPVRLNDGQEARIVMINKNNLARPVIQIGETYIDLSGHKELTIEAIL